MIQKDSGKIKNDYKYQISLKINKSKYSPSEEIEGILRIKPNEDCQMNNLLEFNEFLLIFQEKIAYNYSEIKSKIIILDKKILTMKERNNINDKTIFEFPIKYKLPDLKTKDFYPTFRYFSNSIKCFISHSISIELPNKSNKCSVNIFIKKIPSENIDNEKNSNELNKTIFGDEFIKKHFSFKKRRLTYLIKTKNSINYKEKLPVEIHIDERELENIRIESVIIKIKKNIYIYNDIHIYKNSLETTYNIKKIVLNKNSKNNIINENLELPENEFIPITQHDIQRVNFKNEKYNFTPPVNNILFKCEYYLQIIFHFNSKLKDDKIIDIPIDYYDPQYNKNNEQFLENNLNNNDYIINDCDESIYKEFNEIFDKEDNNNISNNINSSNDKKDGNKNGLNEFNDFVEITKEDFINTIDGKV